MKAHTDMPQQTDASGVTVTINGSGVIAKDSRNDCSLTVNTHGSVVFTSKPSNRINASGFDVTFNPIPDQYKCEGMLYGNQAWTNRPLHSMAVMTHTLNNSPWNGHVLKIPNMSKFLQHLESKANLRLKKLSAAL